VRSNFLTSSLAQTQTRDRTPQEEIERLKLTC